VKALYWRPQRISRRVLALLTLATLAAFFSVERIRVRERAPFFTEKAHAAKLALRAFAAIKEERLRRGIAIDPETDPAQTGMMGQLITPVTTDSGVAAAKQTSINPNFAAVVLHLLKRAGVREGDAVAVGMTGSFPALNVAALAAIETLKARAVVISSAGASQWGANIPGFGWLEMERLLVDNGVLSTRSVAVSLGGVDDRALGLSSEGKSLVEDTLKKSGLPMLNPKSAADSVDKRMRIYREAAGDARIRAFVNVGGGTSTVGTAVGKEMFRPGMNRSPPRGQVPDSVMARFVSEGVPVIHLSRIEQLALQYGLTIRPTIMPAVGEGVVFVQETHSRLLAGAALLIIVLLLVGLLRFNLGHKLLAARARGADGSPEPMV
jgi:poly-gamma-glutamate system protein